MKELLMKEIFTKINLSMMNLSKAKSSDNIIYRTKSHESLISFWRKLYEKTIRKFSNVHQVSVDIFLNNEKLNIVKGALDNHKFLFNLVENTHTRYLLEDYCLIAKIEFYGFIDEDLILFRLELEDHVVYREVF